MNNYICYELEQLEKITGYSLAHIKNDINNVYNSLEDKSKEIERLNNIINELEKSIISKLAEFKLNKDYFIDEKDIEQLYEELKELKESGNNE